VGLVRRQNASLSRGIPVEQRERRCALAEAVGLRHFNVNDQSSR
jgi:hypothetical protein